MCTCKPISAAIEITNRCNLRCKHCASDSGLTRSHELSTQEIITLIRNLKKMGSEDVAILGGEPIMHNDWRLICQEVVSQEMNLILMSNGLLIGEKEEDLIAQLKPLCVGISFDGASPETYRTMRGADGFAHCLKLIYNLLDKGVENVSAITTLTKSNLHEFDSFVQMFDKTRVTWQIQMVGNAGHRFANSESLTLNDYRWLVEKIGNTLDRHRDLRLNIMDDIGYFPIDPRFQFIHQCWEGCSAGKKSIGIRSNGDVLGCLTLGDHFIEANIREKSLEEIWNSPDSFYKFRHKEEFLSGHCTSCIYAKKCQAGCTNVAYSTTGTIGENPLCIRHLEECDIFEGF